MNIKKRMQADDILYLFLCMENKESISYRYLRTEKAERGKYSGNCENFLVLYLKTE